MDWLRTADIAAVPTDFAAVLLGCLLSFLCGQAVAWTYMYTHPGLSYSRSFVNSLVVIPVIVALVMQILSNNLVTAFGLMAVFAIVRFRNILRDTLDTTYVLTTIVVGMAAGTQKYATCIVGCGFAIALFAYLRISNFGARHRHDLILNLHWARPLPDIGLLDRLLQRHSRELVRASQRTNEGAGGVDLSYRLLLRDTSRTPELLKELRELEGVSRITSVKAEDESEL
ncbi:MAG: DUF4956 domain-containing protein [Verrucomicrobiales bacterium]|nr:DUF4956 domain-containing protein [Verrucomicrobiales bacterium]